ncbi:MAG: tail fiber domain-containing protein [Nannocystaceae bacterium]|nr:tail fiber domain-containing protein [bacterium]
MTYANVPSLALITAALLVPFGCDSDGDLGKDSSAESADVDDEDSGDESESDSSDESESDSSDESESDSSDESESDSGSDSDSGGACTEEECGPAPAAPDILCDDGVSVAGFVCVDDGEGCGWQMEACPEPCSDEECGPAPGAPAMLCEDGVNVSGPGPCVRNDEGVCGWTWTECPACCDPAAVPECADPITCCADGTWACGDETACEGGTALECESGGMCVDEGESCSPGEDSCCEGLTCCGGVPVPEGEEYCGAVCPISDKNKKENFAPVDVEKVPDKVSSLEISTWNYTFQDPKFRHLGPMAQDFKATFDIGHTDKAIFQVDADGVALASIQALHGQVKALDAENAKLRKTLAAMEKRLETLEGKSLSR